MLPKFLISKNHFFLSEISMFEFKLNEVDVEPKVAPTQTTAAQNVAETQKDVIVPERSETLESSPVQRTIPSPKSPIETQNQVNNTDSPKKSRRLPQFKCHVNLCDFVTSYETNYFTHMQMHVSKQELQCRMCSKEFSRPHHFKAHLKTHALKCSNCGQECVDGEAMRAHKLICLQLCYGCGVCDYKTLKLTEFVKHMRRHYQDDKHRKQYRCPRCTKRFVHGSNLKIHMKHRHGKQH